MLFHIEALVEHVRRNHPLQYFLVLALSMFGKRRSAGRLIHVFRYRSNKALRHCYR